MNNIACNSMGYYRSSLRRHRGFISPPHLFSGLQSIWSNQDKFEQMLVQASVFPAQSELQAITDNADQCILMVGKFPHSQNTINQQGGEDSPFKCEDRGIKSFYCSTRWLDEKNDLFVGCLRATLTASRPATYRYVTELKGWSCCSDDQNIF